MYRTVIKVKPTIAPEQLQELTQLITNAYDNRCGKAVNLSIDPFVFHFESEHNGIIALGDLSVEKIQNIIEYLTYWLWQDTDLPDEDTDILAELIQERNYGTK